MFVEGSLREIEVVGSLREIEVEGSLREIGVAGPGNAHDKSEAWNSRSWGVLFPG